MTAAKENFAAIPAETLQDFTQFAPPADRGPGDAHVQPAAHRRPDEPAVQPDHLERARPGAARSTRPAPGSSTSTRSSHSADGQGLNMTVQSYNGNLDFGFIACRDLVPDLWSMTDLLQESMQELLDAIMTPLTLAQARPMCKHRCSNASAMADRAEVRKRWWGERSGGGVFGDDHGGDALGDHHRRQVGVGARGLGHD